VGPEPSDLIAPLIRRALSDESARVRREAVRGLGAQPPDPRIAEALRTFMSRETDRKSLMAAHRALVRHDEEYRRAHNEKRKADAQGKDEEPDEPDLSAPPRGGTATGA
jgi:hypothetical protein